MGPSVAAKAEAFEVTDGPTRVHVPWSAVREVTVLKFDRYVVDEIGMLIVCDEPVGLVQLSEHTLGFQVFADAMHAALPACLPFAEWYLAVAFPAFETNTRCIYRRDGEPDAAPIVAPEKDAGAGTGQSGRLKQWLRVLIGL